MLVDDFDKPNGLAFSPDKKVLYIDDSGRDHVRAFDVTSTGNLINGRIFAELDPAVGKGVPDGMKVDRQGRVYVTDTAECGLYLQREKKLGLSKFLK
ncbi:MAG: SMP-30/gluconolactonase/LRE family protein [Paenibacillaceae bacterium]